MKKTKSKHRRMPTEESAINITTRQIQLEMSERADVSHVDEETLQRTIDFTNGIAEELQTHKTSKIKLKIKNSSPNFKRPIVTAKNPSQFNNTLQSFGIKSRNANTNA